MSRKSDDHIPVLLQESIENLRVRTGRQYIDATVGAGGHAQEIVKRGGLLLAIDQDPEAVKLTKQRLVSTHDALQHIMRDGTEGTRPRQTFPPYIVTLGNFRDLTAIAHRYRFNQPYGILFDLGVASFQLKDAEKGLSFMVDAPLDMRLDPALRRSAKDIVNESSEEELYEIFTRNAQEELARPVARAIVRARRLKPIESTGEITRIVTGVVGRRRRKIHPATKIFLALRMETNREAENLRSALSQAIDLLVPGGRLVIISFQESEDRIVKRALRKAERIGKLDVLYKKPLTPSEAEITRNPRSRSAKARVAVRV